MIGQALNQWRNKLACEVGPNIGCGRLSNKIEGSKIENDEVWGKNRSGVKCLWCNDEGQGEEENDWSDSPKSLCSAFIS